MQKTILLTGATDGIGLQLASSLLADGHHVLIHGRNAGKLADTKNALAALPGDGRVESYLADLSDLQAVDAMASAIIDDHDRLDVLINNAGIFKTGNPGTADGQDVRFVVNTLAPWLLSKRLLPLMQADGRIVNLSSAAQAPVDIDALTGKRKLDDEFDAYAQSKLALTMWSNHLADKLAASGPVVVAVNPGSLLATKMVKDGFGMAGKDIGVGVDILRRAALSDEFASANGRYFDNDAGQFSSPHADALDKQKCESLVQLIEGMLV